MQVKKEEMREKICQAALKKFAEHGFASATMAGVAREAGISVGNIYRYYMNKEDLFYALITPAFVKKCKSLLSEKMKAAHGIEMKDAERSGAMAASNEQFIRFLIQYRLQIIIALECSQGTLYETFKEELVTLITKHVPAYLQSLPGHASKKFCAEQQVLLSIIYRNLIQATLEILKHYHEASDIESALQSLLYYHFFGLERFLFPHQ